MKRANTGKKVEAILRGKMGIFLTLKMFTNDFENNGED